MPSKSCPKNLSESSKFDLIYESGTSVKAVSDRYEEGIEVIAVHNTGTRVASH